MADDLPSLSYDPALLGRDLSNSLDLASSAGTTPDEESQLRQAARALGVPLDTARSNPQLAKQEAQRSALDPAGYAARFPSAAKYLADPQNALVSHDDVQPLSAVERAVRDHVDEALGVTGAPDDNPGSRVVNRYLPNYAADKAAEQEVLRTQGFRAASALARRNEERRQALAQTGTGAPDSVKSGAERLLGALSQAAQNVGGSALSGLKGTEAGLAGAAQAGSELLAPLLDPLVGTILPENPLRRVASGVADYQQQVRGGADRLMPKADNDLQAGIYSGIASLSQNLAALPLALAPGGQGAAMSLFTVPVAGNEYAKAREKGASVATATGYAVNQAVIEYATEKLPLNALIGDVKSGAGFLKTLFKQFALEVPGEQIATVLQDMNEWATLHPERSFQDYLNDRPSAAAQTLIATLVGTGGSVTVLSGLRSAADRLERRAQAEQQRIEAGTAGGEHLQRILAAAASSLTRQRDPETFAQLVQDAADSSGTAPSEVFIDARKLVDVLAKAGIPQDQIAKAIPSAADQLAEAVATDGSLALPIGEVTAAFAGSPAEAELAQNLRTSAEGFSAAEASEAQQLLQQLGGQAPQAVADAQQRQAWQDSTSEVHSALVDELNRAGRFTKDVNGAYAELVANFYAAQAARVGSTPKALYDQFPLRVSSTAPGGAALNQPTEGWRDPQNTYLLEADTPPPAPGMIRLYRGEHAKHDRDVFATSDVPDGKVGGWFSPDISEAEYYKSTQEQGRRSSEGKGRIVFIDVPETELQRYSIRGTDLAKDPIRTVENSYYFPSLRRQDVIEPLRYTPPDVLRQTTGETPDLAVVHNLSAENLRHALDIGGLAVPSLAITKADSPLQGFGEISLVGGPEMAKPSAKNPVFDADVYSPRYPEVRVKVDEAAISRVLDPLSAQAGGLAVPAAYTIAEELGRNRLTDAADRLAYSDGARLAYVRSVKGQALEVPTKAAPVAPAAGASLVEQEPLASVLAELDFANARIALDSPDAARVAQALYAVLVNKYLAENPGEPAKGMQLANRRLRAFVGEDKLGEALTDVAGEPYYNPTGLQGKGAISLQNLMRNSGGEAQAATPAQVPDLDALREQLDALAPRDEVRAWAREQLAPAMGEKRVVKANGRTAAYTLDNVVKEMTRAVRDAEGFNYGLGNARSRGATRFTSLSQIQGQRHRITSKAEAAAAIAAHTKRFEELVAEAEPINPYRDSRYGQSTTEWLAEVIGDSYTRGVPGALAQHDVTNPPAGLVADLEKFAAELAGLPTEYFEAKPQRAVSLDEFRGAVVPHDTPADVREQLAAAGLPVVEYQRGDEASRAAAVSQLSGQLGVLFQSAVPQTDTPAFREWFDGSKVVDGDGKPLVLYHGTRFGGFSVFMRSRGGFIYATPSKDYATRFSGAAEGSATYPVFMRLRNPLDLRGFGERSVTADELQQFFKDKGVDLGDVTFFGEGPAWKLVREDGLGWQLLESGYDGVILHEGEGETAYVAVDPEQVKSAIGNRGTFDPNDANILHQAPGAARGTFSPAELNIALLERADLSTFLHETGHFFVEMTATLAGQPNAAQSLKDDARAMLAFAGFTGTPQEWLALPVDQRREAHEKLAESFEQYLFEGKAPTPTLQPLFRRFRSWLVSVYRTIKDMLSVNQRAGLTDEVRAVFDRMIASEQAIDDALEAQQFDPLRALQDLATPEQWAAYQALSEEQKADALDSLQSRTLRDLRWFDNAKSRLLRDMQKEAQAKRKAIRDEVQAEVDQRPVYQAQEFLKRGRTIGENGDEVQIADTGAHKLNIAALEELFPKTELGVPVDWRKLGYGKYGMLSKDGLHPDLVAELFGFPSGRALVTALLNAEPRKSVVDGLTDIRMLERHGDLTSPEAMADAAREALANSARTRLVATEFAILTKAVGSVSLLARAARQTAEQLIAGKKLRALRPDLAAQAAARARRTADKAITTGDMPAAVEAKRSEVLQRAIERAEIAARKEHDKALAGFARIFKGTPEKVAKSRDVDTVNIARAVLSRYGLGPNRGGANALAYVQLVEAYNGPLAADLQSILRGLPAPMDFRDMTLEQFRGLRDTVEGLYYMARRAKQIEIDGKKLDLDTVASEFVDDIKARSGGELPALPGFASTTTRADEFRVAAHSIKANLMRVEAWADVMGAPYKRYIWQPVAEAVSVMRGHRKALIERYRDLVKAIEPGLTFDRIEAPELGGFVFNAGKSELLHALLHAGNTSNLTKLLLGRGWGVLRSDGSLDSSRWDQFLTRMIDQGVLTKADFDFAQGVWDLLEEVKQDAQKAHKQLYGYYFSEVTATPLQTPFGEYRGGYVPAIADALSSPDAAQKREQEELLHAGNSFMFPTTGKGFTQSRVFYNRPLELDLRVIASHLDKVARFAYLEPTIKDVGRLLTNKRVARALNGYDQTLIGSMLNPWLQRTARQTVSMPGKNPKVDRFFSGLRSRAGLVIMFGNVVNTLQQVTGFSLAALKVPAPKLLRAVTTYLKDPAGSRQRAVSASAWMANRLDNQSYAMDQQIREILLDEGPIGRGSNWIKQHAYFLQSAVQNVMDTAIWTGAYDQAVEKGGSHKEAVRYADESVRLSQGSFAPEDISNFEVQTPFVKLFTQFYSYFNMWANLLGGEATKAVQALGWSKAAPRLFFVWFAGMAVPAVVAELIAKGAPGDDDDEDGDGLLDEWLAMFFGAQARSVAAMVPGVGQVAQLLASNMDDKVYNDRLSISPALGMIEAATRGTATVLQGDLADGKNAKRDTRDVLTLLGLLTGLPTGAVARAAGYGVDVANGKAQPEGPGDVVQGIVTGR